MAFKVIERKIDFTFIDNHLFLSRDDLIAALDDALITYGVSPHTDDIQVCKTIQNFMDGLKNITV